MSNSSGAEKLSKSNTLAQRRADNYAGAVAGVPVMRTQTTSTKTAVERQRLSNSIPNRVQDTRPLPPKPKAPLKRAGGGSGARPAGGTKGVSTAGGPSNPIATLASLIAREKAALPKADRSAGPIQQAGSSAEHKAAKSPSPNSGKR